MALNNTDPTRDLPESDGTSEAQDTTDEIKGSDPSSTLRDQDPKPKSALMGDLRGRIEEWCADRSDEFQDKMMSAFGNIIYKDKYSDREINWMIHEYGDYMIQECKNADSVDDLFSYFYQALNSTVLPALQEARLWKDDEDEPSEQSSDESGNLLNQILEESDADSMPGEEPDNPDHYRNNRVEQAEEVQRRFG